MTADEKKLSAELKGGTIRRVYYFYGEEVFLTDTYTKRVIKKTVGDDPDDVNLIKFSDSFTVEQLADSIESLPMFAECKTVLIKDFDCEKFSEDDIAAITDILDNTPAECTVVFSQSGISQELLAKKRNKAFIDKLSKQSGTYVVKFAAMTSTKIADLIMKKATKNGCTISRQNAVMLAEMSLNNLTLCSSETDKLCSYVQSGEITADIIDKLVLRLPDAKAYAIGTALAQNNRKQAFMLLDELYAQRVEPVMILGSLSGAYIDFYRASCAKRAGKTKEEVIADFAYPKRTSFLVGKAFTAVSRMRPENIRKCISLLKDADMKLKTTGTSNPEVSRRVLEQAVAGLLMYAG
ncbi:MAG: DNA polymerase III subunit delta [Eubacterium sp.]|nr:DNA polymerase III subunit delta [Eubacterium sp.]